MKSLSSVRLLVTPWTVTHQAPPSMGFSRQEYWSGVPLPSPNLRTGYFKLSCYEGPKLLHFVNRKTPFCKVPGKAPLEIQEPLEIPPPTSQSDPRPKSPDLTLRNLWSTSTIGTNQEPTHNPSKESGQSDIPLPRNPFSSMYTPYISNAIQNPGLLPIAAVSVLVGAPARAW